MATVSASISPSRTAPAHWPWVENQRAATELAREAVAFEQNDYYNGGGSVVANAEALARLPETWREKVSLSEVTALPKGFRAVVFLYRPGMKNKFRERPAALVRHEVEIRGFVYELQRTELEPKHPAGLIDPLPE